MFGLFKRNQIPAKLAELRSDHIKQLLQEQGPEKAGQIARRAAVEGSTDSAVFMSVVLMQSMRPGSPGAGSKKLQQDWFFYTALAARRGDAGSQFNLAKHYLSLVDVSSGQMSADDFENLCRAEKWFKKSAAGGLSEATKNLAEMSGLLAWARKTFEPTDWERIDAGLETRLKELVREQDLEVVVNIIAKEVVDRIPDKDIAYEFMLQELDGASRGNDYSRMCASCSGIAPKEYKDALNRSIPEVDGPDGPQQFLLRLSLSLSEDRELMAKLRCDVGSVVQKHFKLGLHSPHYNACGAIFGKGDA